MNQGLLQPTLNEVTAKRSIYPVGALIAAAFFGGTFAVCLLGAENSRRQQRLRRDVGWIVAAVVLSCLTIYAAATNLFGPSSDGSELRLYNRAGGFALVGLFYQLHRTTYRTQTFAAADAPSPYAAVIFVSFAGVAFAALLAHLLS